jgi:E3 ubiquitin-protein ligase Topors
METPERLDNCPSTPELDVVDEVPSTSCNNIEEARLTQLKQGKGICVICYSSIKEGKRCFPDSCLHIFHFDCLQRWSEQKNQCPLCKKVFDQIIHNIKSKTEYERYPVTVLRQDDSAIDLRDLVSFPVIPLNSVFHRVDFLTTHSPRRRFTYRTRFEATLEQNERIQELFGSRVDNDYARLTPAEWRRYIYERNLYALPLSDLAGRYRECSAQFYRENPAQTHRLIPWLNRELVVLMQTNQTTHIPQILEDMRDMLCRYDIQSRKVRKYFQRYLHLKTDHFVHEFYNFAISPYDIVGYDRHVDYNPRNQSTTTTVEISSSTDSSDGDEVQVIDVEPIINEEASNSGSNNVTNCTTVVLETQGSQEDSCVITEITTSESNNNNDSSSSSGIIVTPTVIESNPVVLESSSDSECEFVLALKPPHLRTPEMMSLDSASDSDCIYIPNQPTTVTRVDSSTTDSEDNKPLAETKKQLKSEVDEMKPLIQEFNGIGEGSNLDDFDENLINTLCEPSTSKALEQQQANGNTVKKIYFAPKRKNLSGKSIFDSSSSSSSTSSNSGESEDEWETLQNGKTKSRRKLTAKKLKKMRLSTSSNPKPLSQLQSSEEATHINDENDVDKPRIKSVIIKKTDNAHYIQRMTSSSSDSSSDVE